MSKTEILPTMKLRIFSDGTLWGTGVIDIETGRVIPSKAIRIELDADNGSPVVWLKLAVATSDIAIDMAGDFEYRDFELKGVMGSLAAKDPINDWALGKK